MAQHQHSVQFLLASISNWKYVLGEVKSSTNDASQQDFTQRTLHFPTTYTNFHVLSINRLVSDLDAALQSLSSTPKSAGDNRSKSLKFPLLNNFTIFSPDSNLFFSYHQQTTCDTVCEIRKQNSKFHIILII